MKYNYYKIVTWVNNLEDSASFTGLVTVKEAMAIAKEMQAFERNALGKNATIFPEFHEAGDKNKTIMSVLASVLEGRGDGWVTLREGMEMRFGDILVDLATEHNALIDNAIIDGEQHWGITDGMYNMLLERGMTDSSDSSDK